MSLVDRGVNDISGSKTICSTLCDNTWGSINITMSLCGSKSIKYITLFVLRNIRGIDFIILFLSKEIFRGLTHRPPIRL